MISETRYASCASSRVYFFKGVVASRRPRRGALPPHTTRFSGGSRCDSSYPSVCVSSFGGIASAGPRVSVSSSSTFQIPGVCAFGMRVTPGRALPFHVRNPQALPLRPLGRGFMRVTVQNESGAPRSSHRARANRDPTPYEGRIFASSNTATRGARGQTNVGKRRRAIASGEGKGTRARTVGSLAHEVHREVREVRVLRLRTGRHRSCARVPAPCALTSWLDEAHAKQNKVDPSLSEHAVAEKKNGDTGYRSPDLVHAKHTLCHLSYIPTDDCVHIEQRRF